MNNNYLLYGVPFSYYTAKARAYFIQKNLDYTEVLSTLNVYRKVIKPKTGVSVIPVVKTPEGEYLQDTAVIIDHLEKRHPENTLKPQSAKQRMVSALFEIWADEWLLLPAMHYRWNKANFPYIYEQFGTVVLPGAPGWLGAFAGRFLGSQFKGFVPKLGITPLSIPAIEHWYESIVLKNLDKHFEEYDYLLGDKPCVGDCALMGPLFAHLYRDPAPGALMRELAPNLCRWIERMNSQSETKPSNRDWLPGDEIPESLIPLLANQFQDFWPLLPETVEALKQWREGNSQTVYIPRIIGEHSFKLGEIIEKRAILPFQQWKLQRVQAIYHSMSDTDRVEVDRLLDSFDGKEFMYTKIDNPVTRKHNRLVFD